MMPSLPLGLMFLEVENDSLLLLSLRLEGKVKHTQPLVNCPQDNGGLKY